MKNELSDEELTELAERASHSLMSSSLTHQSIDIAINTIKEVNHKFCLLLSLI